jgi:NADPH-dependent glutamate synthase beta subunit-like oxidoreductase/dihydroorotate dehydrogenase
MRFRKSDILLPVEIAGVMFRNPFYVASGPTTMSVDQLVRIEETGWGGASLKLTIDPTPYINRYPRYSYYREDGILSFTTERRLTFEQGLRLMEAGRRATKEIVLFSNITYSGEGVEGWVNMAKRFEQAGAHINELNMCCPNMSYNVELSEGKTSGPRTGASLGQQLGAVQEIVRAIKEETGIPLFVKLTPEGGGIARVAQACYQAGADAVGTTANRLAIHHVNLDDPTRSPVLLQEEVSMHCMCSSWVHPLGLRDVYEIRRLNGPGVMITGTGGVTDWRSAAEMVLCGADLLGICAETLVSGFGFLPGLVKQFKKWFRKQECDSLHELTSVVPSKITAAPDVTLYAGHARLRDNNLAAPCVHSCPASVPAQAYISKIADGEFREAYELLTADNPLMSICAYVCDHPCEESCVRGLKDEALRIRDLKRFLVEKAAAKRWKPPAPAARPNGKSVAVIGTGPSGLTAASMLVQAGYRVTAYEAESQAGGMLRFAIPAFRLPESVLDYEIGRLQDGGVEFVFDSALGREFTLAELRRNHDAVYIAVGARKSAAMGIPGEHGRGVVPALDFLRRVRLGEKVRVGRRVAVIGGGFTAVDSARTAVRLGAREVYMLYRRTREEMPAYIEEVAEAEEEGVKIMYLVAPRRINSERGRVVSLTMANHVLGEADASGRRRPLPVEKAEFNLPVDQVIVAIGQAVDLAPEKGIRRNPGEATILVGKNGHTGIPGVFAGGDAVHGAGTVIQAIAEAKDAAAFIDRRLMKSRAVLRSTPAKPQADAEEVLGRHGSDRRRWRIPLEPVSARERKRTFELYAPVLSDREAVEEASRCYRCGCGEGCMICHDICKVFAFHKDGARVVLDEEKCVACGMCIWRCPTGNLQMIQNSPAPL